jgi:hypothetical protein
MYRAELGQPSGLPDWLTDMEGMLPDFNDTSLHQNT